MELHSLSMSNLSERVKGAKAKVEHLETELRATLEQLQELKRVPSELCDRADSLDRDFLILKEQSGAVISGELRDALDILEPKLQQLQRIQLLQTYLGDFETVTYAVGQLRASLVLRDINGAQKQFRDLVILTKRITTTESYANSQLCSFAVRETSRWFAKLYQVIVDADELNTALNDSGYPLRCTPADPTTAKRKSDGDSQKREKAVNYLRGVFNALRRLEVDVSTRELIYPDWLMDSKHANRRQEVDSLDQDSASPGDWNSSDNSKEIHGRMESESNATIPKDAEDASLHQPFAICVELLLRPLRRRFAFAVSRLRDAQRSYLQLAYFWMRDADLIFDYFFDEESVADVEQDLEDCSKASYKREFVRGIVALIAEQVRHELAEQVYDDADFAHLIDVVLMFYRDLCKLLETASYFGNVAEELEQRKTLLNCIVRPLCKQPYFDKWLRLEALCATDRLDSFVNDANCWSPKNATQVETSASSNAKEGGTTSSLYLLPDGEQSLLTDVTFNKTPAIFLNFVTLLRSAVDRMQLVPAMECRIVFFERFVLELLSDFRIRVVQSAFSRDAPVSPRSLALFNGIAYLLSTLHDLDASLCFLELHEARMKQLLSSAKLENNRASEVEREAALRQLAEQSSPFDHAICSFQKVSDELFDSLVSRAAGDFSERLRVYHDERWNRLRAAFLFLADNASLSNANELITADRLVQAPYRDAFALSLAASDAFLALRDLMFTLHRALERGLFLRALVALAQKADVILYREVLLSVASRCGFNEVGAAQFQFDVSANLLPLFAFYVDRPERFVRSTVGACHLLTLKPSLALLLIETLQHEANASAALKRGERAQAVRELVACSCDSIVPSEALRILNARIELAKIRAQTKV